MALACRRLKDLSQISPWVKFAFVDGGYAGDETQRAADEASRIKVIIVKYNKREVKGLIVLPKRWVVQRTLGRLNRAPSRKGLRGPFPCCLLTSLAPSGPGLPAPATDRQRLRPRLMISRRALSPGETAKG
jgi:hypothetical protein